VTDVLLGQVADVKGATVTVALDDMSLSGLMLVEGRGYRIGQIGSLVRLAMGYISIYGVVSQVGAGAAPQGSESEELHGYRWMTVQLLGEAVGTGGFRRGVSQYPTLGDSVFLVLEEDMARLYGHLDSPGQVAIGTLATSESIPALLDINKLVTRHVAVVGSTGSGKSTTVAGLVATLSKSNFPSARILILDNSRRIPPRAQRHRDGIQDW
jgi:hypothetical protein